MVTGMAKQAEAVRSADEALDLARQVYYAATSEQRRSWSELRAACNAALLPRPVWSTESLDVRKALLGIAREAQRSILANLEADQRRHDAVIHDIGREILSMILATKPPSSTHPEVLRLAQHYWLHDRLQEAIDEQRAVVEGFLEDRL